MQLSFGDAEDLGQRKRTRREVFLAEMEQVVPWTSLLALIAPHYPKMGRPGRQPYALSTMLRIHFLQQWYALSDPAMEEALYDTPVVEISQKCQQLMGDAKCLLLNWSRLFHPWFRSQSSKVVTGL